MVLLLRSQGIPARLVTGFLGAEQNPFEGFYVVRQSNAHAWVEGYPARRGAVALFDPTPAAGRPGSPRPSCLAAGGPGLRLRDLPLGPLRPDLRLLRPVAACSGSCATRGTTLVPPPGGRGARRRAGAGTGEAVPWPRMAGGHGVRGGLAAVVLLAIGPAALAGVASGLPAPPSGRPRAAPGHRAGRARRGARRPAARPSAAGRRWPAAGRRRHAGVGLYLGRACGESPIGRRGADGLREALARAERALEALVAPERSP